MRERYLECGKIINTHGVRGGVKLEAYCDSPSVLASIPTLYIRRGDEYTRLSVLHASVYKGTVIATLDGITTLEAAEALKNKTVYTERESVPKKEGAVFLADIIGLPVIDIDTGRVYGNVSDIDEAPASRIFTVSTEGGDVLLPDVREFIKEIDTERGVFIRPISGFFDDI